MSIPISILKFLEVISLCFISIQILYRASFEIWSALCTWPKTEHEMALYLPKQGDIMVYSTKTVGLHQGLKMSGSGAARKLLPANPHSKFVTISQEIFRVESPMLCERLD